jgi:UDP-N-acetylmuramate: L-alanyl-gamma-D-glutamyl-meso-diaminopimelate ligase
MTQSKLHFIAIGGSAMHNLAIDAKLKGFQVTGSDDEIFDPSRTRLEQNGLLPTEMGWSADRITSDLDAVIVGMHAHSDNPEILKAQELGLKIYSFPEYVLEQSRHKHRIVIAGSHGKTTITAMIMHVLKACGRKFDYLVGASVDGFENQVSLSKNTPTIIIEGDEYLSAPFDKTPKFLRYQHHVGVISGIAWDHMNVYPSFDEYVAPFEDFADATPKAGSLIYSQDDSIASVIGAKERTDVVQIAYQAHPHKIVDGVTYLTIKKQDPIKVAFFGEHNLKNVSAAKAVCARLGIDEEPFYKAISSFKGAGKRLERVVEKSNFVMFKDYAHSPSKVLATTSAVKRQYVERKLIACLELHTYSSLNKDFLPQYNDTLNTADQAIIYFNPKALAIKKIPPIPHEDIAKAFDHDNLKIFEDSEALEAHLASISWHNKNLLMMSSGNFNGLNLQEMGNKIASGL